MTPVSVVGIGADGWAGLTDASRAELIAADVVVGSARQLALLPASVASERVPYPSPLVAGLPGLLDAHAGRAVAVLASGDPMFFGVGATLARLLGPDRLRVLPHVSSATLACARLGWAAEEVETVSLVGRPLAALTAALAPGRRVLVLSAGADTPALVAALLTERGYGASRVTVLGDLGAANESRRDGTAAGWPAGETPPALNVMAVACTDAPSTVPLGRAPGLPDEAYESDGQLTKQEVRAVTLAKLAPLPGELLWDVGAGSGSVAVEWLRAHPSCRAVAVERDPVRADRVRHNADALGVPRLRVVTGAAPGALGGLPAPSAVFVGGGVTGAGVVETCWDALTPGGRLVANAVTVESEAVLAGWHARLGGDLVRLSVQRASPVGGFTGWRPLMPVTIWTARKEREQ
ncbi:precorrin-6y C5,15-methyltransferase (decarboxylating) subunit CbiE [Microbispora triticiradicis]|uniref:precorrin-6y C5,15-methyltransferase (decarboxylating) subunit CbiE n=1 Tax=Microbispora triticiradicis TaxID=2200763 RepID=UPI001AD7D9E6|nr:precorrin-6y C5,15-methyltransferase (decarboxylating) subunit CbiE [Microbispora triticiradicis]MBO4273646.1 precorrin-6y C5,15-methyltransferase (decarboxylating) subunit CbiE [Microbispora triticiradicis]